MNCMNVRGCNQVWKRERIGMLFQERRMDVFALSETKLRGSGEYQMGDVKGVIAGVPEGTRAKEGVALLLSEDMWANVLEWRAVSSRIVWVRLKLGRERVAIVSVYAPGSERTEEERECFWEQLSECLSGFAQNERAIVLGDMNARVGDAEIDGITGHFGVTGINESGERLIEMCASQRLIVGNTWFKKKSVNKYTWRRDNGSDRALMDYVLVDRGLKGTLQDVHVYRGPAGWIESDHFLVEARFKWKRQMCVTEMSEEVKVVKVSELQKREKAEEYMERMNKDWMLWKERERGDIEEEWRVFKTAVMTRATEVCGMRRVGGGGRKSEWWNEEVAEAVKDKSKAYQVLLQKGDAESRTEYKRQKRECERVVKQSKKVAAKRWGERVARNFQENKKLFWKGVNRVRKPKEQMSMRVKDANGQMLNSEEEVRQRWSEYFEELLNVEDESEAVISCLGRGGVRGERALEQDEISVGEVEKAIKELKCGKSSGEDGITAEMLKAGGRVVVEWMMRICFVCMSVGRVPEEWRTSIVVPIYKGKGAKDECKNYRGISLLSVPGKVYGRLVIERVRKLTERSVRDEQGGFRKGRGCVDQVFMLKNICEKYLEKCKDVFVAFMDLEKAYDRVDRKAMWQVLRVCGIGGKLLEAVKSFYEGSTGSVRVGRKCGRTFTVEVGLRQGCVMSPWLFNLFMDGVVREVDARMLGRGVRLRNGMERDMKGCEWQLNQILYADDTALVADDERKLQMLVTEFERVCKARKLCVNVGKSKVMRLTRSEAPNQLEVWLSSGKLEEVRCFRYLGVDIANDGTMREEVKHRVTEGERVLGALRGMWTNEGMTMDAKKGLYEGVVVPTLLYGSETWSLNASERKRFEVTEMKCLRSMCGVSIRDRVRNEEIRRRCGGGVRIEERVDRSVLRWYGHVERMGTERVVKRVYESSVDGKRARGRPRLRWSDSVRVAVERKGLDMRAARMCVNDRMKWRRVVYGNGG